MKHCTWTVFNMGSLGYILLVEIWQRLFSHRRATFALREEAVETLSTAWRCSLVSLDLYLDLLKFKVENNFSHKYVLPKRHMVRLNIRESSGKLGGNSLKNFPSLSASPLTSLKLTLSAELHCRSMSSIWSTGGHLAHQRRKGPQKFEMLLCASWSLQICDQIPPVASKWPQHTSHHWMVCLHPRVPCMLGNGKGLLERAGLSITWVLCRMLWHCHRQHWHLAL